MQGKEEPWWTLGLLCPRRRYIQESGLDTVWISWALGVRSVTVRLTWESVSPLAMPVGISCCQDEEEIECILRRET